MIDLHMRPTLARKARLRKDERSGGYMLLYPERGMQLNATGVEILQLCNGEATVLQIMAALVRRYAPTPSNVIESEVLTFLNALQDRALLARDNRHALLDDAPLSRDDPGAPPDRTRWARDDEP